MNLARWLPHLAAARRQGKTVAAYAAEHGLSRHTLCTAPRIALALYGDPYAAAFLVAQACSVLAGISP